MAKILAVNAGSSTLKWKLFDMPAEVQLAEGLVDRLGQPQSKVKIKYGDGQKYESDTPIANYQEAVASLMGNIKALGLVEHLHEIIGVGHRVVAGGEIFAESVVVDDETLLQIQNLRDYAPLHNPVEADYISVFRKMMHLGSGSSITAVQGGQSIDTSMGFTPLAGVTMGTRSGDIDPSLVGYLMKKLAIPDVGQMIHILNNDSGLLGISGLSNDMRDLEAAEDTNTRAKLALDIFVNRVVKYVGSYAALMDGVDVLVFTAGIGENGDEIRDKIMRSLDYLSAKIDNDLNYKSHGVEADLSTADSTVKTLLVPTNEELMIVRDVMALS